MGNRMSPLRRAVYMNDTDKAERILAKSTTDPSIMVNDDYTSDSLFCCCYKGWSLLHTSLNAGREIVHFLVENGADPNQVDSYGVSCLQRVAMKNNLEYAELFVNHGGNIYARDPDGFNAIHWAALSTEGARYDSAEVLEYFIRIGKKEDLEMASSGGTPLDLATAAGNDRAVRVILEAKEGRLATNSRNEISTHSGGAESRLVLEENRV